MRPAAGRVLLSRTSILLALTLLIACHRATDERRKHAGAAEQPGSKAADTCDGKTFAPCKASCDAGGQDHCMELANLYLLGKGGATRNFAEAMRLHQKGCDGGIMRGCVGIGLQYRNGQGVKQSDAEANPRFEAACQANNGAGCNLLGFQYQDGRGYKRDERRAFEFFNKACDLGKLQGCALAGRRLRYGLGRPKEPMKGFALFKRACDGDDSDGCYFLAYEYLAGGTQPRDDLKALALNRRACDLGAAGGCRNVGLAYAKGASGLPVDKDQARALFKKACDAGFKPGCDDGRAMDRPAARRGARALGGGGDASCPGPGITRRCNGVCVSLQTNSNCGGCGAACRSGYHCDGLFCRDAAGSL